MTPKLAERSTIDRPRGRGARFTRTDGDGALATAVTAPFAPVAFTPVQVRSTPANGAAAAGAPARPWRRDWLRRRLLASADALAVGLAVGTVARLDGSSAASPAVLAGMALAVAVFKVGGIYDRDDLRVVHSTVDEVPRLLQLTAIVVVGVAALGPAVAGPQLTGRAIGVLWLTLLVLVGAGRALARSLTDRLAAAERCVVVGTQERAARIARKLASSRARAVVVAVLPLADGGAHELGAPADVRRFAQCHRIDRVIVAPSATDYTSLSDVIRLVKAAGVRVSVLPRMCEAVGSSVVFDDVDGMTMLGVRPFGLPRTSLILKRAFDLAATTVGVVLASPILAAIAIAIRVDTPGPVLYRQERVGRDGARFRIFKFRSMRMGADTEKDALRGRNEAGGGLFKIRDDPRVTRVGRFLRRTSLDELPQVLNVLRGEMSLVGPRPLVVDEDALVVGLDRCRRAVAGARGTRADGGDGRARLPLRGELVALGGREAPAAHRASRAARREPVGARSRGRAAVGTTVRAAVAR
jgi:lipopolysaccharide/colanic/teichoic acid biosynthesis glycosyltransferase